MSKLKAISLMGPTASGKTSLSIKLAQELNGEIISVDSVLIYKGMDIGAAKPTIEERQGIKHHLIDILDPKESYSVADFRKDVLNLVSEIHARNKFPILVGGTMMYFKSIVDGLSALPNTTPEIREKVNQIIAKEGLTKLRDLLKEVDKDSYLRLNENDGQRLGRAYELYLMTGKSMTTLIKENPPYECPLDIKQFALIPDRERKTLRPLIAQRFEAMLEAGMEAETRKLYERGDLDESMPSIRSVGYRQMWQYFKGELSFEEMKERAIIATCQLAKRQMTWLRGWKTPMVTLVPNEPTNLAKVLENCKDFMV